VLTVWELLAICFGSISIRDSRFGRKNKAAWIGDAAGVTKASSSRHRSVILLRKRVTSQVIDK
jgi:hypothetical protein